MKKKVINLIDLNSTFFYNYYILKSSVSSEDLPNIVELAIDSKKLNELLRFKKIINNKNSLDHKYNLVKNTFWKISGLNSLILQELEKNKTDIFN